MAKNTQQKKPSIVEEYLVKRLEKLEKENQELKESYTNLAFNTSKKTKNYEQIKKLFRIENDDITKAIMIWIAKKMIIANRNNCSTK